MTAIAVIAICITNSLKPGTESRSKAQTKRTNIKTNNLPAYPEYEVCHNEDTVFGQTRLI